MTRVPHAGSARRGRLSHRAAVIGVSAVALFVIVGCDTDEDRIPNSYEKLYGWDIDNPDEDGNGTLDGEQDHDDDRLLTHFEVVEYPAIREDRKALNPRDVDSDDDGLVDGAEVLDLGIDPLDPDTDDDGLTDGDEMIRYSTDPDDDDTDNDGLDDGDEVLVYRTNPEAADSDDDRLDDIDEVLVHRTNPNNYDSDFDGLEDGAEVTLHGTSPTNRDTDGDTWLDGDEIETYRTDPLDAASKPF